MCRREVRGGGPGVGGAGIALAGGRAGSTLTQEGGRAWLQAHHSASCLPQARDPGGLSSPLPACWVNIVISTVPPAWDGLVLRAAQGHGAGGRQGYGEVTRCLEDDSGPEGGRRRGREPGALAQPHLHRPLPVYEDISGVAGAGGPGANPTYQNWKDALSRPMYGLLPCKRRSPLRSGEGRDHAANVTG